MQARNVSRKKTNLCLKFWSRASKPRKISAQIINVSCRENADAAPRLLLLPGQVPQPVKDHPSREQQRSNCGGSQEAPTSFAPADINRAPVRDRCAKYVMKDFIPWRLARRCNGAQNPRFSQPSEHVLHFFFRQFCRAGEGRNCRGDFRAIGRDQKSERLCRGIAVCMSEPRHDGCKISIDDALCATEAPEGG